MKSMTGRRWPLAVARDAYAATKLALPKYSAFCSPHKFTQWQLFAILALRHYLGLDLRTMEQHLKDWSDLRDALELTRVPHYSTLCVAEQRFEKQGVFDALLDAILRSARDRGLIPDDPVAAIDSTGLDAGHISDYYRDRRPPRKLKRSRWIKVALVADLDSSFFLAARVCLGLAPDYPDFIPLVTQAHRRVTIHRVLADAGYDSEANLRLALETLRIPQRIIRLN